MRHGEVKAELLLSTEPSRLFRIWRSTFGDTKPTQAQVSILKSGTTRYGYHAIAFSLCSVTNSEKKLAEISLSEYAPRLDSAEIANSRLLNDILWDWLSVRGTPPMLDQEMPFMKVSATLRGTAESIIAGLEKLQNLESVVAIQFFLIVDEGRPPKPVARMTKRMEKSSDIIDIKNNQIHYKSLMSDEQINAFSDILKRAEAIYRRRSKARREQITTLAKEKLGGEANTWLTTPQSHYKPQAPIHSTEDSYTFFSHLNWLTSKQSPRNKHKRTSYG